MSKQGLSCSKTWPQNHYVAEDGLLMLEGVLSLFGAVDGAPMHIK